MKKFVAILMAMMMTASFAACSETEAPAAPAETPAAPVETPAAPAAPAETPAAPAETPAAPAEEAKPEAIDLNAKMEEIKAATGASEITATVAAEGITIDVKADSEEIMNAANFAIVEVLKAEDFVAANLFENTEENVEKAYTINFYVGSEEVTHKTTAGYASSTGRKGILYICNKAWSGPKAVEAEA